MDAVVSKKANAILPSYSGRERCAMNPHTVPHVVGLEGPRLPPLHLGDWLAISLERERGMVR